MGEIFAV